MQPTDGPQNFGFARLLAIFILALGLRVPALPHGLPGLYVPDTHCVRNALGMLQTRNLVPRANEYSSYPYLFAYGCLPLFAGDYAIARASGRVASVDAYKEDAQAHLERFHFAARVLAACMGAAAAAAAAYGAAMLAGRRAGWLAGFVASVSPMPYLISLHERPWSSVYFFTALAAAFAFAAFRPGATRRPLIFSALAAGAAAGCHQTGAGAALLVAGAVLFRPGATLARRASDAALTAFAFVAMFLIGNPYYLRYGLHGAQHGDLSDKTDVSVAGQGIVFKFDARYTGEAVWGVLTSELWIPFAALAGAWWLLRRRDRRLAPMLLFAAPITAFFLVYTGTHARYFLLVWPVAWMLAGVALSAAWRPPIGAAAVVALLALPAAESFRTARLLASDDTRELAKPRVEKEVPAGSIIAAEPYGPALQPSAEWLRRLAALPHGALTRRETIALEQAKPGGFGLIQLEKFVTDAAPGGYSELTPLAGELAPGARDVESFLRTAGAHYLLRIDRFPRAPRSDAVAKLTDDAARAKLLFEVAPVDRGDAPEALLPFEPRLGVVSLFGVDRPGPRVRLYQLLR